MDPKDLRTLHILESTEREHPPSQRDLARELNISLGLVNSFIRRLVKKGYFKITHIPKNRIRYILTPKGAAEKSRLTYDYILYSYNFFKNTRERLQRLFHELQSKGVKRIVFFGNTELAEIAFLFLQETDITLVGVIDDDRKKKSRFGRPMIDLDQISKHQFDIVLNTDERPRSEVLELIQANSIPKDKIVFLL